MERGKHGRESGRANEAIAVEPGMVVIKDRPQHPMERKAEREIRGTSATNAARRVEGWNTKKEGPADRPEGSTNGKEILSTRCKRD